MPPGGTRTLSPSKRLALDRSANLVVTHAISIVFTIWVFSSKILSTLSYIVRLMQWILFDVDKSKKIFSIDTFFM